MELDAPLPRRARFTARTIALAWSGGIVVSGVIMLATLNTTSLLRLITGAAAALTLVAVVVQARPKPVRWWWLFAGTVATSSLVSCLTAVLPQQNVVMLAWLTHGLVSLATAVALFKIAGSTRSLPTATALDAVIVALGMAQVVWAFVIDPLVDAGMVDGASTLSITIFPIIDLALVVITSRLAFASTYPMTAHVVVAMALVTTLLGDASLLAAAVPTESGGAASHIGWVSWAALAAVAALHPDPTNDGVLVTVRYGEPGRRSRTAGEAQGPRLAPPPSLAKRRLVVFVLLALLGPAMWILDAASGGTQNRSWLWTLAPAGLSGLLTIALTARLGGALRQGEALHRELAFQADHDALTGLYSRDLMRASLDRALTEAAERPTGLLLIDLDGFKDINDAMGHPLGDDLLIAVADRLREVAGTELLARLGGDEFAVITVDDPEALAERLVAALSQPYQVAGHELHLTASIGLVVATEPTAPDTALQNADLALYAAKAAGKNRTVRYDDKLRAAHLAHNEMAERLHQAVEHGEFVLNYQPVVELETGRVSAVEALLRWRGPDGRPVSPAAFIPVAEEIGLIGRLGGWVLDQACADAQRWHTRYGMSVTVNVSGHQLSDPGFADQVLATLQRSGLPKAALVLEITETVLVAATTAEAAAVSRQLARLRAHGIRVAIDDFGTGYSSLAYLRNLPADVIKIDRSFVERVNTSTSPSSPDRAILRAMLDLTASLYLQPVAEGVETAGQAHALADLGCRYVQGYLFARPAPAKEIDSLLERKSGKLVIPAPEPSVTFPGNRTEAA